jgi:hypothetical protein
MNKHHTMHITFDSHFLTQQTCSLYRTVISSNILRCLVVVPSEVLLYFLSNALKAGL